MSTTSRFVHFLKKLWVVFIQVHPKKSVIIFSPSCHRKPVWLTSFFGTQKKTFFCPCQVSGVQCSSKYYILRSAEKQRHEDEKIMTSVTSDFSVYGIFKVWSLWKVIAHLCSTIRMIWAINQGKACRLENVSCQHLLFWGYFIVTRFNRFWKPAKRYLKRVINLFFCTIIIIWGSFGICRFINPII